MRLTRKPTVQGTVHLPGDKSISHRAVLLASIAEGTSRVSGFASSADCASTISCMRALGIEISVDGPHVEIKGRGKFGLEQPLTPLDCGNSGTTMRLLSGILAGMPFESTLVGDASLSSRPMKRIIDPLSAMGAEFASNELRAPLTIRGRKPLAAIEITPSVASAQLKSAVLLAGLYADGVTMVTETIPTRDHTERMLKGFGVDVISEDFPAGKRISVSGDAVLSAADIAVPADVSASAFFLVAAACVDSGDLVIPAVGVNPTRTGVIDVLRRFGVNIEFVNPLSEGGEPIAELVVKSGTSAPGSNLIDGAIVANLIDEVPILAVFGTQVEGGIEIRGAAELRVKECDRIAATALNLRKMGADVEEFEDGLKVGRSRLRGAVLDSYDDHRIAMAFSIAGILAEGETEINGSECVAVSFPEFYRVLAEVAK